jgi:hypothetical protein
MIDRSISKALEPSAPALRSRSPVGGRRESRFGRRRGRGWRCGADRWARPRNDARGSTPTAAHRRARVPPRRRRRRRPGRRRPSPPQLEPEPAPSPGMPARPIPGAGAQKCRPLHPDALEGVVRPGPEHWSFTLFGVVQTDYITDTTRSYDEGIGAGWSRAATRTRARPGGRSSRREAPASASSSSLPRSEASPRQRRS